MGVTLVIIMRLRYCIYRPLYWSPGLKTVIIIDAEEFQLKVF